MEKDFEIDSALAVQDDCILLKVHVAVRSQKSQIKGMYAKRLKILLNAIPEDGAANSELISFLANYLNIANNKLQLISGLKSKNKTIAISGIKLCDLKDCFKAQF